MSSTTLKVVAIVAVILAAVLAFAGYRMSMNYAAQAEEAQQQAQQQQVQSSVTREEIPQTLAVVAVKALAAYQPIPRDAVALVPVSIEPTDPFDNLDDVVDKIPLVDIDAGAPVTHRYFRDSNMLARVIPDDHMAMSVEINDVIAVGGFVRPGDIVDVLIYLRGGTGVTMPQARILMQKVRVLAYEERIIDRPQGVEKDERQQRARSRTAVLAIPEKDTTRMMLGMSLGDLRLALHGEREADQADVADEQMLLAAADGAQPRATATPKLRNTPDQVIGLEELARMYRAAAPGAAGQAPRKPKVEVFRGSAHETVTTQ
ncbi:Flp pilus assembly protein CpaB [Sinimarinibacterium sp. NLF-5-8]|uniref:Flp pilus assembly protein CpaB n=1 Tax=Sinimarinibacterium sp. NLF-5-8 TaxID=2698684 RepID=UPI00137BD341|nr:Flp pilus assembly protein CpaB [Sinimarinibacterium sp. NLF-5-8]QHS09311.1 Flp pilus assembly protein CpaB [Sinimarinibacterium sp. NLF-5-8]